VAFLPLNIDVRDRNILVVGGGTVAVRKIRALLKAEAVITVVAPQISSEINLLASNNQLNLVIRQYHSSDLDTVFLAVAATNDTQVNSDIATEARQRGILVNVTDDPLQGNCQFPAVVQRGDLQIGVSTHGRFPGFAVAVRDLIANGIGDEFGILLNSLAKERDKLLTGGNPSTYNGEVLRSRINELLEELIKHKDRVP
jgi:precorrin-2 dehydrogenase/sirohydrochlorin ferrochelatase